MKRMTAALLILALFASMGTVLSSCGEKITDGKDTDTSAIAEGISGGWTKPASPAVTSSVPTTRIFRRRKVCWRQVEVLR